MSALVRLYPAAWRDRYEEEFLAVLEARPPTVGDRFDIVRGAVDARIHPQVRRPDAPQPAPAEGTPDDWLVARRLGIGALAGAVVWLAMWWVMLNGPVEYDGYGAHRDGSAAFPLLWLSVLLLVGGLIGQLIRLPPGARVARGAAVAAIAFSIMWMFGPWQFVIGALALLGLVTFALAAQATAHYWSAAATVAVVGGCLATVVVSLVLAGGLAENLIDLVSVIPEGLRVLLTASLVVPIWLGIGGTLVGSRPAETA
jgi:hypothetical protein